MAHLLCALSAPVSLKPTRPWPFSVTFLLRLRLPSPLRGAPGLPPPCADSRHLQTSLSVHASPPSPLAKVASSLYLSARSPFSSHRFTEMKTYTLTLTLLSLLAACSAQAPDAGGVAMDRLMAMKLESRKTLRANRAAAGGSDSARRVVGKIPCLNGFAGYVRLSRLRRMADGGWTGCTRARWD